MAFLPWLAPAHAEPNFPELTGRVVDDADLLSYPEEVAITADLKALEDKSSDQVVVVTLPSLQGYTIEDFGYQLGRHWGIGTEKLDNGVILIVAPNERKVRIEVGRGLEGVLTDALSKIIIENAILPRFREGNFAGGIKDGVRDVILVLTGDAAEVEQRAKARQDADESMVNWLVVIFWTLIILWIAYSIWSSARYASRAGGRGGGPIFLPGPGWGSGSGGSGWSGGRRRRRRFLGRRRQFRRRRSLGRMVSRAYSALHVPGRGRHRRSHHPRRGADQRRDRGGGGDRLRRLPLVRPAVGRIDRARRADAADLRHQMGGRIHLSAPAPGVPRPHRAVPVGKLPLRAGAQMPCAAPARISAPSSSSSCRTCTPPKAAPAC